MIVSSVTPLISQSPAVAPVQPMVPEFEDSLLHKRLFLITATIALNIVAVKYLSRDNWMASIVAGTAGGAGIFLCYALAYILTDRLIAG
jgi:hypothetical protein